MEIHLAIAFDENYLSPFYALITSIYENNKDNKIIIHAIASGITVDEKNAIINYALSSNSEIHFYSIDIQSVSKYVLTSKWTSAVYYRLHFPLLMNSNVTRLLYLDTDTIVNSSLSQLYILDLENKPVGAVYDNWVKKAPQLGIIEDGNYFNSGVLLIDIQKWKAERVSERAFEYLSSYPERINFVDQDALNAVLINNWKKLDYKFNLMYSIIPEGISKRELDTLVRDKVIIHFTLQRPWHLLCKNRLRHLYYKSLKKSPFPQRQKIIDFEWSKLPDLLKLRITEFYYDSPKIRRFWRKVKT